jgi:hypothetical protein
LASVDERARALFGEPVPPLTWARLVGAPDGTLLDVAAWPQHQDAVRLVLTHNWIYGAAVRFIFRDVNGELAILNEHLQVRDDAPPGIATRMLAHLVREASRRGVRYIQAEAAGGPGSTFNGYYTWARLGFEGRLPPAAKTRLPKHLAAAEYVLDLMALDGGREWWKAHGRTYEGTFDLTSGSRSLTVLRDYTLMRGIAI